MGLLVPAGEAARSEILGRTIAFSAPPTADTEEAVVDDVESFLLCVIVAAGGDLPGADLPLAEAAAAATAAAAAAAANCCCFLRIFRFRASFSGDMNTFLIRKDL